jgi:putative ABC transport system permease protein
MPRSPFADRLYRLLLRLFPHEFRGDFGQEMTQVFRDERRDAAAAGGWATAALWARTLAGFARTAPREHLHILLRDAIYGLRLMRRHPGVTAVAVLTIGIGVGVNTVMLTVVRSVLLEMPFRDPDRLAIVLLSQPRGLTAAIPLHRFRMWQAAGLSGLEQIAGFWSMNPIHTGAGPAERLRLECVTANTFPMLGVEPLYGRTFVAAEDQPNGPPVIVLGHRFWVRAFAADPGAVGQRLLLDNQPYTVVGVMPAAFDSARGGSPQDGWLAFEPCLPRPAIGSITINAFARIRTGFSAEAAAAQMDAIGPDAAADRPAVKLGPLTDQIVGDVREPLLALLGAAVFVLLIACSNVASLMLGRADARRRELGLRLALGCSRARMARQLLTESLVFAVLGGAGGVLMSRWTLALLLDLMPASVPRATHITLDWPMMAASFALALASGLLFGLLPAWRASHADPAPSLKEGAQTMAAPHRRLRLWLVGLETALAIALVVGAALEIKTFMHLRPDRPGFDPSGKVIMAVNLRGPLYRTAEAWSRVNAALLQQVQSNQAYAAVSAASYLPMSGLITTADVTIDPSDARSVTVDLPTVTPNYFSEMNIPILSGRGFTDADNRSSPAVAIVSDTMARRYWPGRSPIGARVRVHQSWFDSDVMIVGTSGDVRSSGGRLTARAELYVPFAQHPSQIMSIIVRTGQAVDRVAPLLRADLSRIDPNLPAGAIEPLAGVVAQSVSRWRFAAWLVSAFAGIALCLSAVGLFAVVAAVVSERTAEIGVRVALGATRRDVLRVVLNRSLGVTLAGTVAGLGLALATTRFLALWLEDVSPFDRGAFAGAAVLMVVVSLAASLVPARRAMRIDPLRALRHE